MNDEQLQVLVRASLDARAREVDTSPAVVSRVVPSHRPRRGAWVAAGAALAVAATVAAVAVLGDQARESDGAPPAAGPDDPAPVPATWRDESWGGLTVSVPPDWGYGGAPMADGTACWPSAMRSADGVVNRNELGPYVGRPIAMTDVCVGDVDEGPLADPTAPNVWLGAGVDPGTVDLGDGWVRETVIAYGTTLSVTSHDVALREQILASARPTELCPAELAGVPEPAQTDSVEGAAGLSPSRLTVCAYRREDAGQVRLSYAAERDDVAAETWLEIVRGRHDRLRCASSEDGFEWVVLRFEGKGDFGPEDVFQEMVLHLGGAGCPRLQVDSGTALVLTAPMVRPWATGGVPAVVYGPNAGKGAMIESFIGPLG
jgi:hypothetical protein